MTSSRAAVDTNVLVHLYDDVNAAKRTRAEEVLAARPVISPQVVSEYLNVTRRLLRLPKADLMHRCSAVFMRCEISPLGHSTILLGQQLLHRYDFQLFDALVVAGALEARCDVLYSADFQHNQLIEGRLRIFNPFR